MENSVNLSISTHSFGSETIHVIMSSLTSQSILGMQKHSLGKSRVFYKKKKGKSRFKTTP
jgi:hypothetical protein